MSEESLKRVRKLFQLSSPNSVRNVSRKLAVQVMTMWNILRIRLQMRPYRLLLLQFLKPTDYTVRTDFAIQMLQLEDDDFLDGIAFSDDSTFHLIEKLTHITSGGQNIPKNSFNAKGTHQN